ncbi:MAG: S9 family peptidase [Acidobacteria bacterium]|nr:S9 family peptidase [Acidobacteriota bacterium]
MLFSRALVAVLTLSTFAIAKDPITHERLWMMKRVSNPVVSPDGKWVVFTMTEPSYEESGQSSDLWIVPADGSAKAKKLTSSKGAESGAAWSRDSRRIAFGAKREGDDAAQIYVMDVVGGGEAQRVTSLSTGVSGPVWSPDGKSIAFLSNVYPGARTDEDNKKIAAERKARKYKARVYDSFPIRAWDHWRDDLQVHLFVQAVGNGKARDLLAGTQLVSQKGFAGAGTSGGGEELQPAWTPDGTALVFVASVDRNKSAYADTSLHLYQVSVAGGEPRVITQGHSSYAKPAFRPDGKALYALREPLNTEVHNNSRLAMMAWPAGGAAKDVTTGLDFSVNSFAFSSDSRAVYFTAEDQGLEKLYALPAQGGKPVVAANSTSGVYGSIQSPAGAVKPLLTGLWSSAVNPAEVVRIDPEARSHKFLTEVNTSNAAAIDWQPLKHFWFTSAKGRKIHNMIALPANFDPNRKYPLLVLMHGGPHSMWRDEITLRWNYHLLAAREYVVLLTNYTGSTGFGEKFAQVMKGDPFQTPAEEINQAADEAIKQFSYVDGSRQCAAGASYGGHLANWLEATTTRYKCLISHAGLINMESQWGTSDGIYHREVMAGGPPWEQSSVWREQNPIRRAKNFKTPMMLTVGENDYRVPLNQTLENWSVLQRMQVPSKLIVFPDANHWILKPEDSRFFYQEVGRWLGQYLKN